MRFLLSIIMITTASAQTLTYPETSKSEVTDEYFGMKVSDPYRWLEDDNSTETKAWVKAQNEVTFRFLEAIPQRDALRARLKKLWNYERFGIPFKRGDRWFFSRNYFFLFQNSC